jgi:hypothetical protein
MTDEDHEDRHERRPADAERAIRQEITRMFGEQVSRLDALSTADSELPVPPPQPKQSSGFLYVAPLVIVVGILGLALRIVFLPFRKLLRRRAERAEVARLDEQRLYLRDAYDKLERDPSSAEMRINLAVMLVSYDRELAERELDEVVRTTPETEKIHAVALHNRGIVRTGLHLERLGSADVERAKELGFVQKRAPMLAGFLWFTFRLTAGLQLDD